jgi:hypothetical protein
MTLKNSQIPNCDFYEITNEFYELGESCFSGLGIIEITIPTTINNICNCCFDSCTKLRSIEIPSSISKIPSYCFMMCGSLSSVIIPNSVTKIDAKNATINSYGFYNCEKLTSIIMSKKYENHN